MKRGVPLIYHKASLPRLAPPKRSRRACAGAAGRGGDKTGVQSGRHAVIPAKAGPRSDSEVACHPVFQADSDYWIPAYAGMTI